MDKSNVIENLRYLITDRLGKNEISPSIYDTAWIARISNTTDKKKPVFPEALNWLKNNQNIDGSWGEQNVYYQDRILNTLAVVTTFKIWNMDTELMYLRAVNYLNDNINNIFNDHHSLVGFEVLFFSALDYALKIGISINSLSDNVALSFQNIKEKKLKKIPLESLYRHKSTLSYSLEFLTILEEQIDYDKLSIHKELNGSIACSPSSTAFYYIGSRDSEALAYLQSIISPEGFVPILQPIDIFDRLWTINYLIDFGVDRYFTSELKPHIEYIYSHLTDKGLPLSVYFPECDLDETSIGFRILKRYGYNMEVSLFDNFFDKISGQIFCYKGQIDNTVSHILHFLLALNENKGDFKNYGTYEVYNKIAISSLEECIKDKGFYDKWHISKFYTYGRLLQNSEIILNNIDIDKIINELSDEIHMDKLGFGLFDPTIEETSYVMLFLKFCLEYNKKSNSHFGSVFDFTLKSLKRVNIRAIKEEDTKLWVGKVLFRPNVIVEASILSSLIYIDNFK